MGFFDSALELLSGVFETRTESLFTASLQASPRQRLKQDKLSDPERWQGYCLFISATPPEGEPLYHDKLSDFYDWESVRDWIAKPSTADQPFDRSREKSIYYTAFRYCEAVEGSPVSKLHSPCRLVAADLVALQQIETIYR